jgi:hypothetical protein
MLYAGGTSRLTTFLALYRGESVSSAKPLALKADCELVRDFAARLLDGPSDEKDPDPVLEELEQGRRRALRLVKSSNE